MASEMTTIAPRVSLLGLPLELRDKIYRAYFQVEGGYVYDGATDTLVQANGEPVDIALRYVCRSIAWETTDLPFQLNSIKFSTVHRDDWQEIAGILITIIHFHHHLQSSLLQYLRHHITPDMYQHSNPQYLDYMPAIKKGLEASIDTRQRFPQLTNPEFSTSIMIQKGINLDYAYEDHIVYPEPRAVLEYYDENVMHDRAVAYILRRIQKKHPDVFARGVDIILPGWTDSHPDDHVLEQTFEPWAIPSLSEARTMAKSLQLQGGFDRFTEWGTLDPRLRDPEFIGPRYQYRRMAFFSASAVAIRFLNRIHKHQRLSIRRIIIDEDRPAVARSMCHAIGLIPFCKENSKLHVEQRLNLWSTILLGVTHRRPNDVAKNFEFSTTEVEKYLEMFEWSRWHYEDVKKDDFSSFFFTWTMHILAIVKSGMPLQSYTVMIDGDPDLNHSSLAFHEIMEREIAWLTHNTDCVARGLFAPPNHQDYPLMTRRHDEGVASPDARSSLIQCNFTLDQPWDSEKIAKKHSVRDESVSIYRSFGTWRETVGGQEDGYFVVSTDVLDFKSLQLLWVERKLLPEGTGASDHDPGHDELPQEGQESSHE